MRPPPKTVVTKGHEYLRIVSGLPKTYRRLIAGDVLRLGGRAFEVLTGGGHSPEQVMLLSRDDKLFFAADQVLAKITPNVSVAAVDPAGDPLGIYLRSLAALKETVADDVLILPGHQLPFTGLGARASQLRAPSPFALRSHRAGLSDGAALGRRAHSTFSSARSMPTRWVSPSPRSWRTSIICCAGASCRS